MAGLVLLIRYVIPLWFVQLLTNWLPDNKITLKLRGWLAHFFIKNCGRNFQLASDVTLLNTYNLEIGNDVYIAKGSWLNAMGGLKIEDEVILAPYVVISTMQHVFKDGSVRFGGSIPRPVVVGKGTWIAAHAAIKCGVRIGKGNIIAANAFLVKDSPDFAIMGGVPAVFIKGNSDTESEQIVKSRKDLIQNQKKA